MTSNFPEKVYIPRDPEYPQSPNIWWEREPSESNIEYIRTDAFIGKACEWIKEHSYDYLEFGEAGFGADFHYPKMIEDFRKAMKGEQGMEQ